MSEPSVGLKTFVDQEKLKADVSINPADLDGAMLQHAGLSVFYGTQAVYARQQYERMKSAFEILEAKLDNEYRETLKAENPKTTEAAIKAAVLQDTRYVSAQGKVIEAQTIYRLAEVAADAFSARKDMILEVARDRRKEREGELRVMAQDAAREMATRLVRDAQGGLKAA